MVGSSLAVILQSDRTMFYHPCFDFVGIGRGTATAVVGSSLAVILWVYRAINYRKGRIYSSREKVPPVTCGATLLQIKDLQEG